MAEQKMYQRFSVLHRIEHWVVMASFTILAITGLIQKFAGSEIARGVVYGLGGIETTRLIHRFAAVILMIAVVYHMGVAGYRVFVTRRNPTLLPGLNDMTAAWGSFLYNLGLRKTRPQEGRYTFGEKFEYWAVVWGTSIMIITGFMMWNPIATTRFLPGESIPAAKTAHGGEALLAVLSIIIWHLYNVLVRTRNTSMFTGKISEHEMIEEHPLELADIKAGLTERPATPQEIARRKRIFWPVYTVVAAAMLVFIYWFATFEQTAKAGIQPAETVVVYAPLTPTPLPTLPPTATAAPKPEGTSNGPTTWEGGVGLIFQTKCTGCHGANTQMGSLNLASYQSALTGGKTGPGFVAGNPDQSEIVIKQSAGGHPGQLSDEELALIKQWIQAGANEK